MKIMQTIAAAVLLAACCTAAAQGSARGRDPVDYYPPQPGENESRINSEYIKKLVLSYVNAKIDISEPSIVMEICSEIGKYMKLESKVPADVRTDKQIAEEVDRELRKKYTKSAEEYRKDVALEAEKKFRLYQFGEKVTIHYRVGNSSRTITGTFGQFNGRGVTIGYKHIPFYDIQEEDKAHVSKAYADTMKKRYIQDTVDAYVARIRAERFSKISLLKKQIMTKNRQNGYMLLDKQWISPKLFAEQYMKEQIKLHPEILRRHGTAAKSAGTVQDAPVVISTDGINMVQLKQKLAAIKNHLAEQTKIDQDSGCLDAVYWGFTREEVKASLADQGINMSSTRGGDEVYTDDRQIENISLFYTNNRLTKLEEVYLFADPNITAFTRLKLNLAQKYGTPDNVKDIKLVPAPQSVSWTGKYTKGTLELEMDAAGKVKSARFRRVPLNAAQPFGKDIAL